MRQLQLWRGATFIMLWLAATESPTDSQNALPNQHITLVTLREAVLGT